MHADEYQTQAMRTRGQFESLAEHRKFAALELASEAGEVASRIYKEEYQLHPYDEAKLVEELGDVLWGIACMCDALGISMSEVMTRNITKLTKRYPNGFTPADSLARRDHNEPA